MSPLTEDEAELSEINVTPLIDVMLVLLIIFMVAAPLSTTDLPVDLPSSAAAPSEAERPLVLTLLPGGGLELNGTPVEDLAGALAAAGDQGQRLHLQADKAAGYGEVMALLDRVKAAGFVHVALVGLAP